MKGQAVYSIVIPTYNSPGILDELIIRIKEALLDIDPHHEIILINDGSKDDTWDQLINIKGQNPGINLQLINLKKNYGQHKATLCGFHVATGKYIITMDDDLQTPPEEITKLIDKQKEDNAALVYGIYGTKQHSMFRNLGSSLFHRLLKNYASFDGKGTSFRLITKEVIEKISSIRLEYVYIDEILHWFSDKISYIEVDHHERPSGRSGYRITSLISMAMRILFNYTTVVLKFMEK